MLSLTSSGSLTIQSIMVALKELESNLNDLAIRLQKTYCSGRISGISKEVNEIVSCIPHGLGLGTFIWEATSPMWGELFDKNGRTTEYISIYPEF